MINIGAAAADLFRWLYLNKNGGVYFDIDIVCKYPISNFINTTDDIIVLSRQQAVRYTINHAFIATVKYTSLFTTSISNAINNILYLYETKQNMKAPQDVCGPRVLGATLNILLNKPIHSNETIKLILLGKYKLRFIDKKKLWKYIIIKYDKYMDDCMKYNMTHWKTLVDTNNYAFDYKYANKYITENQIILNYKLYHKKLIN